MSSKCERYNVIKCVIKICRDDPLKRWTVIAIF